MRKIFACISLASFLLICSCHGRKQEKVQNHIIEFYTMPNGTMVDTRIPQNIADNIIRRLNAIENGDLSAFRATFEGHDFQDGAGINMHMWFVGTFFGDIIGFNWDNYDDSIEEYNKVFHDEFPPQKRNMWASIEKIEIIELDYKFCAIGENFGISAYVQDYEDNVVILYLGIELLPYEKDFIGGGFLFLEELLRSNPCCLYGD